MRKFLALLFALLLCVATKVYAEDAATVTVTVKDLPQKLQNRTVIVTLGNGPSDTESTVIVLNGLNNYTETVTVAPSEYYCAAAVQYDALGDYPLQEINQATFLRAEGGNHYDLIYTLVGSSWYESVTGQQRHYTLQPLETPPENYEPKPAQVGAYLTAPVGFSQHVIVFLSRSTEINNEIINVEGLLQSSIQEQRPKARLDMHSIEAALSDDASFPDGKIEPGFLDRYANRIVKSNNRYIWMLQLVNVQQIMPIQSERQPIAMVTYKSGVPYDIEQEQTGKQDKESAGPDCATICRPQDFFLNMSRTKRKRKLVEWLESCQENQVNVLDEKIPLLSFAVDFVTAYEYQKARGIKIHPGLWKDMRVDIFLVKKEN